ncbi:MAG: MCE family protein, partial [Armatimonadetes bacterium]|nr:MCE family protein [Armatimonadota bacterium]
MGRAETFRVGLATLAAIGLLVWATYFFRGGLGDGEIYRREVAFPEAQGLQRGAYVRVRGVDVGQVEQVRLDVPDGGGSLQAILTLALRQDVYRIQDGDGIRIVGSLFSFNPPYVEITPAASRRNTRIPGSQFRTLQGDQGPSVERLLGGLEQLAPNLNRLTEKLTVLVENLADVSGDRTLRASFQKTAVNLAKASERGVGIADNVERATRRVDSLLEGFQASSGRLQRSLDRADGLLVGLRNTAEQTTGLMKDARTLVADTRTVVQESGELVRTTTGTVRDAGGLVTDTRTALSENREKLTTLLDGLNRSVTQLNGTLAEAKSFLGDRELRTDLKATAANLKEATEGLKKTAADVQGLTGDPEVQQDLRATISQLREATAGATEVMTRARDLLGSGRNQAKSVRERLSQTQYRLDLLRRTREDRTRLDFDATIPWSPGTFYRVGFYDLGEATHINAQAGQRLRHQLWGRYGIRASRLGLGLDYGVPGRPLFSLDAFGVDRPEVELRG